MSNYAAINNYCDDRAIQELYTLGFLGHTNFNGNAPLFATEEDGNMLPQIKSASFAFEPTLSGGSANASISVVTALTALSTLTPTTAKSLLPSSAGTSIAYNTSCGIFALQLTDAVVSGSNGSLKLVDWVAFLRNAQYSLMVKYFSDVAGANVAIGFDVTDMPLLADDTALAFQFVGDQEALTAINGRYVLQGNANFEIVGVNAGESIVIDTVKTTLYKIRVQA